jgi:hypothetical protein
MQHVVGILITIVVFSGINNVARADQLNLIINGKAIHLDAPSGMTLNEKNWGIGLQYDYELINTRWLPFTTVSGFIDSMNKPSYYAGGGLLRRYAVGEHGGNALNLDAGVIAFMMTRADYKNYQLFPGVLPVFSFGTRSVALNMTYIPKVHPKLVALWFFQLKLAL